jgi:1-aminocyclopropane-1-carboxylate deaminase/D-cysteine desulfhydrase-like pyridoxal-dependent ACC family enzyme
MSGTATPLPLLRWVPGLADLVPRIALGDLPTPVEPLALGVADDRAWVKRDDLTGEVYGGNKVRKLEFLLGEARRRGAGRVITAGALGSHHALATTVYGRRTGFAVSLVLSPQRPNAHVRRILRADRALGAEFRLVSRMELLPVGLLAERMARWRERPFVIPPGGSDALGTLGYVNAALELLDQVEAGRMPLPDTVHVACGTMGTVAGLAVGFALAGASIQVRGVRIVGRKVANRGRLGRLVRGTSALVRKAGGPAPPAERVVERVALPEEQLGEGYGRETEAGRHATERFRGAGLGLDATYTAKAAAGFLAFLERDPGGVHLYWHTLSHGIPRVEAKGPLPAIPERLRVLLDEA